MLELLAYLRENGFKTYIVSGGGVKFMRPWTERADRIPPEQVVGSSIRTAFAEPGGRPVLMRMPESILSTTDPAMPFPPFPAGDFEGIGVYPHPPEVIDRTERGAFTGERRDTLTYVCKRPGRFFIPAVQLRWWDLDALRLRAIDFPQRSLDVAANPAMAPAAGSAKRGLRWQPIFGWLAAFALAATAAAGLFALRRTFWPLIAAAFRPVHLAPLNPEPVGNLPAAKGERS